MEENRMPLSHLTKQLKELQNCYNTTVYVTEILFKGITDYGEKSEINYKEREE